MDHLAQKEIRTKYFHVINKVKMQTSISLSQNDSEFLKEKFHNKGRWIQRQYDILFERYRGKFGDEQAKTVICRKRIQEKIKAHILSLRWEDAGL